MTDRHPKDVYPELWAEAEGDEARFVELLMDRGEIEERIQTCRICGASVRHRHGPAGEPIELDRAGNDVA